MSMTMFSSVNRGNLMRAVLLTCVSGLLAQPAGDPDGPFRIVSANSQFAVDLYKQINATAAADNIFLSPYSVSTALAMPTRAAG